MHSIEELKDTLYQQIETLAEESKKTSDTETYQAQSRMQSLKSLSGHLLMVTTSLWRIITRKGVGWNGRVSESQF